jgi:malonate decarboxylase gamma subunit
MTLFEVLNSLFPAGHTVREEGELVLGAGRAGAGEVAVVGTRNGAEVGVEVALALSAEILRVIGERPGQPILVLVDTRGQRMSRRDEVLGLAGYLAHLATSLELARQRGHRLLALIHGQAASASAVALGLMADEVHALEGSRIEVMALPAMSRVTRIPLERLEALARESPVLAPGLENFLRVGCVASIWSPPLEASLLAALARPPGPDLRDLRGLERGGRTLAHPVALQVEEAR